jgi:hypothetical protein
MLVIGDCVYDICRQYIRYLQQQKNFIELKAFTKHDNTKAAETFKRKFAANEYANRPNKRFQG